MIVCLECGREFKFLPSHLRVAHQLRCNQYRERWQIPAGAPLASEGYRAAHRAKLERLIADGTLRRDPTAASVAAIGSERRPRTPQQIAEQAERARQNRPGDHSKLPPGARRADGRDADRARLYQKEYRRQKSERP